jgi:cyclic pyranopterin phosphate synthase
MHPIKSQPEFHFLVDSLGKVIEGSPFVPVGECFFEAFLDPLAARAAKIFILNRLTQNTVPKTWSFFTQKLRSSDWVRILWTLKPGKIENGAASILEFFGHEDLRDWKKQVREQCSLFTSIDFELNSMCNRRCTYCPNHEEVRPVGYLSYELFAKAIRELAVCSYSGTLQFNFYGEPLLDRRLPEFVAYAKEHCPSAQPMIYTNGDFLTQSLFEKLSVAGVHLVVLTLHDGDLRVPHLDWINSLSPQERSKITIQIPDELFLDNRVTQAQGPRTTIDRKTDQSFRDHPCFRPYQNVVVTAAGKVLGCCLDFKQKMIMGDLTRESLMDIWMSAEAIAFRESLLSGNRSEHALCKNCDNTAFTHKVLFD